MRRGPKAGAAAGSVPFLGLSLEQVAGLLTETAQQQQVLGMVAGSPLAGSLAEGVGQIRDWILHGLSADSRLAETGIAVIGGRRIRPPTRRGGSAVPARTRAEPTGHPP